MAREIVSASRRSFQSLGTCLYDFFVTVIPYRKWLGSTCGLYYRGSVELVAQKGIRIHNLPKGEKVVCCVGDERAAVARIRSVS